MSILLDGGRPQTTLTNIITNGNFTNGDSWTPANGTEGVSGNVYSLTGNGDGAVVSTSQSTSTAVASGKKIYIKLLAKVTNADCSSITVTMDGSTAGTETTVITQATPSIDTSYVLEGILTTPADFTGNYVIAIKHTYASAETADTKVLQIEKVIAIDIRNLALSTNTVLAAKMDESSGTVVTDSIQNYQGTAGAGAVAGASGRAFDGGANAKITYGNQVIPLGAKSIKTKIQRNGISKALEVLADNADMSESNHGTSLSLKGYGIDQYVKLSIQSNTSNGSTTFSDSSTSNHSISRNGDTQHSTTQKKFGSSSIFFDGTGDDLVVASSNDFIFGSDNFTIDWWQHPTEITGNDYMVCSYNSSAGNSFYIDFQPGTSNRFMFYATVGGSVTAQYYFAVTKQKDVWKHYALVRNGTDIKLYENGTALTRTEATAVSTNSIGNTQTSFVLGSFVNNYYFKGYIDEFRVSKGIARWTSNFTPPTTSYNLETLNFSSYKGSAGKRFDLTGKTYLTDNVLYDVMCTWDGTTSANKVKMYIKSLSGTNDGKWHNGSAWVTSIASHATTTAASTETTDASYNLVLGQKANTGGATEAYGGTMSQVEINNNESAVMLNYFDNPGYQFPVVAQMKRWLDIFSGGWFDTTKAIPKRIF